MAKRFTDTEIWDQDWFVPLPNKYKILWQYVKDKCDDCGVWRPNKETLQLIIGEPLNLTEFIRYVNTGEKERIAILPNGRWFLKEYFFFQYGDKFNPRSPVHRGVLKRLLLNGVHLSDLPKVDIKKLNCADNETLRQIAYEYPTDTLLIAYGYPSNRVKDKDKDKDKEYIIQEKGGMGGGDPTAQEIETNETMIVLGMERVWKSKMPMYAWHDETDKHALLRIAYIIAEKKGWKRSAILDIKEFDCINSWKKIVTFLASPEGEWYKKLTLDSIATEKFFQKIEQSMTVVKSSHESGFNKNSYI